MLLEITHRPFVAFLTIAEAQVQARTQASLVPWLTLLVHLHLRLCNASGYRSCITAPKPHVTVFVLDSEQASFK